MRALIGLHNGVFSAISTLTGPWLLPTLMRFTFAATLLQYFWNSAQTKLDGGLFSLSFGAYAQVLPRKYESLGYDPSLLSFFDKAVVFAGTYAEFILPALIVIGLFTRLASIGMIGFIAVLTYVDIYGHMADPVTIGTWFDRIQDSQIMDQRLFWIVVLITLVVKGAGPVSVDRLIKLK
ncbi:MAG: DoxX family protein [Rhodobacteraceae bacterium]|nr:DoxX family protein [Paracoccaceae bacterium]